VRMTQGKLLVGACELARARFGLLLALTILGGCYKVINTENDSIEVSRDVPIDGLIGHASSLAAAPGGGFVVAGSSWAVATDANGRVLWRYADSDSDATQTSNRSEFHGVVGLANGNTLLCGLKWTEHGSTGLLTILNSSGELVEKRLLAPAPPDAYIASALQRCRRWGNGILLMGTATTNYDGRGWLAKLDGNGAIQWEVVDPLVVALDAVEIANHNIAIAAITGPTPSTTLVQVTPQGQIASTKALSGFPARTVRSAVQTSTLKVQTNIDRAKPSVVTLNDNFEEIAPLISTEIIMTGKGCAWVLSDGSIALFGNVFASGGVYRAAAARIGQGGKPDAVRTLPLPRSGTVSAGVYDAIPIADRTFVAVRDVNNGVVLSWITFK
jgi:hypothetical protein